MFYLTSLLRGPSVTGPSLFCQNGVAPEELLETSSVGEAGTTNSDVLLQTEVLHLVEDSGTFYSNF